MVVARTSAAEPGDSKARGISVFVGAQGFSCTEMNIDWQVPERQYSVAFDDVVLDESNRIGPEGEGAKVLFDSHELRARDDLRLDDRPRRLRAREGGA